MIIAFRLSSFDKDGLAEDPTLRESQFVTWTSAELHYSLVAATIPILRPFMSNLSTNYGAGQGPEGSGYAQGSTNSYSHATTRTRDRHASTQVFEMKPMTGKPTTDHFPASLTKEFEGDSRLRYSCNATKDTDAGSTVSNESQRMIIRKDITWQVDRDGGT